MMYNRFINKFVCVIISGLLVGCSDFLDEKPKSSLSPSTYFNNDSEARIGVNGLYNSIGGNFVTGNDIKYVPTDLVKKPTWSMEEGLGDYTFSSSNSRLLRMWKNHYLAIKDCNSTIDAIEANRDKIPSVDRFIGEARGIRGFLYFDLVRWYGDVPLVLHAATSPNSNSLKVPRNKSSEVFQQIIDDLTFASENSVSKNGDNGYQYGRFSREAALGFLAKVHLYIASITERDGKILLEDAKSHYKKAMDYAKMVIDNGGFKLTAYYPDMFDYQTEDKAQEESLFSSVKQTGDGTGGWVGMVFGIIGAMNKGGSWGMATGTDFHRSIYEESDSIRRLWNCPRMKVMADGSLKGWDYPCYYQDLKPENEKTDGMEFCIGKFRRYPLVDPASYNYQNFGMDEPLLRFSDILLIYAEAFNEYYQNPGDYTPSSALTLDGKGIKSAYDAVNVVRKRARIATKGIVHADVMPREYKYDNMDKVDECVPDWRPGFYGYYSNGMDNYSYRGYSSDYQAFREEILWERAREFVAETTDRWCDLTRRGCLVQKLRDVRTTIVPYLGKAERTINAPGFPENVKSFHQLLPIPQSEIDSNGNLTQNPGY